MSEFFFIPDDTVAESFCLDPSAVVPLDLRSRKGKPIYLANTRDGGQLVVSINPDGLSGSISATGPTTGNRQMFLEFVPTIADSGAPLIVARPHTNLRESDPALGNLASFLGMFGTAIAQNS
jgi:hypothetical protein